MKNNLKYIALIVLLLIAGGVFYKKVYLNKLNQKIVHPKIQNIQKTVFGVGNVDAQNRYSISSQVGAKILFLQVQEGDYVKEGETLVKLDSVDLPTKIEAKKLSIEKINSDIKSLNDELLISKSKLTLDLKTYKRYKNLRAQGFVSKSEFDKVESAYSISKSNYQLTKRKIDSLKIAKESAKKDLEALQTKLALYTIYAPVDGYIISKYAQESDVVLPSKPILTIINAKDVWVKIFVDEKLSGSVKIGDSADIKLRSNPNIVYKGKVAKIELKSDPITLEREIDIRFNKVPIPFFINEQADATIYTTKLHNVATLPSKVLIYRNGELGILVKSGKKSHFKSVKILYNSGKVVAIKNIDKDANVIVPKSK